MNTIYFPLKFAISQHDKIIDLTGGLKGIKDPNQLESSLLFIQNDTYYPEFTDKLTHLVHSIAMNHCFSDGNKRSSIVLGAYFLELNGYENIVPVFILEMENIILWVANHFVDKKQLNIFIKSIVEKGGFDEVDKLKITKILTEVESKKPELTKETASKAQFFFDKEKVNKKDIK